MALSLRIAAAAIGVTGAGLGMAQNVNPFYARLGVTFPMSSDTRRATSNTGFTAGLGYNLPGLGLLSKEHGHDSIELLYNRFQGNGNHIDQFTLQFVERFDLAPESGNALYGGVGLGVQMSSVNVKTTGGGGGSGGAGVVDERRTTVAGELLLGYRFNTQFALEASVRLAPEISGINTNTLSLMANFKF